MTAVKNGLEFDPGFSSHVLAFQGTVPYVYAEINRYKNLSQKKTKFLQYHKKILDMFYNNIGFYTGCLMWAAYIKAQPESEIISNPCFGTEYNAEENVMGTQYMLKFTELFPNDMKYFLGKDFSFEPEVINLIKVYEDFLVLNKGFTETKLNSDLVLPEKVSTLDVEKYKELIDNAISKGDLLLLKSVINTVIQ